MLDVIVQKAAELFNGLQINWRSVTMDFEKAMINALTIDRVFNAGPLIETKGCHFHFCQLIMKNAKKMDLINGIFIMYAFKNFSNI